MSASSRLDCLRRTASLCTRYTIHVDVPRAIVVALSLLVLPVAIAAPKQPLLVCYGDSITAGPGLPFDQTFPADLQKMLNAQGYRYTVRNLGSSGATTKDALANLPNLLRMNPAVVILEFGGNDGLRGLPLTESSKNLDRIITASQKAHIRVLLAGITLPPNYGQDYIHAFDEIFRSLAAKHRIPLVPMIYKNLIHVPGTIQADGIHPTAKGAQLIAETLLPALKPLLIKSHP